jgi:hypothetical protein
MIVRHRLRHRTQSRRRYGCSGSTGGPHRAAAAGHRRHAHPGRGIAASHMTPGSGHAYPGRARARRALDHRDPPTRPFGQSAVACRLLGFRLAIAQGVVAVCGQATPDHPVGARTLYWFGLFCAPAAFTAGPEALCATITDVHAVGLILPTWLILVWNPKGPCGTSGQRPTNRRRTCGQASSGSGTGLLRACFRPFGLCRLFRRL